MSVHHSPWGVEILASSRLYSLAASPKSNQSSTILAANQLRNRPVHPGKCPFHPASQGHLTRRSSKELPPLVLITAECHLPMAVFLASARAHLRPRCPPMSFSSPSRGHHTGVPAKPFFGFVGVEAIHGDGTGSPMHAVFAHCGGGNPRRNKQRTASATKTLNIISCPSNPASPWKEATRDRIRDRVPREVDLGRVERRV